MVAPRPIHEHSPVEKRLLDRMKNYNWKGHVPCVVDCCCDEWPGRPFESCAKTIKFEDALHIVTEKACPNCGAQVDNFFRISS